MALGRSGGMLPRIIVENLDAVMATLVRFEQFLWQILFNFFTFNPKFLTKHGIFYSHIFGLYVLKA